MIRSQSEVEEILKSRSQKIRECIESGFNEAIALTGTVASSLEKRTKAGIKRDLMVDKICKEFESDTGVMIIRKGNLLLIAVEEKLQMRVKKMDGAGRSSNYPTQQALEFDQQQLSLTGKGFDEPTNLNVGYVSDKTGTEIEKVLIACPNGGRNEWVIDLEGKEPISAVTTFVSDETKRERARIKKSALKEKKADESKD